MTKTRKNYAQLILYLFVFCSYLPIFSQIVLLGDHAPYPNVNDGDFNAVNGYWRQSKQSPFWTTKNLEGLREYPMGLHYGTLFSSNDLGIAESKLLNTNPDYKNPKAGDIINWSFGADLEYVCNGTISLSLVFGNHETVLAKKVKLIGSDKTVEHFSGSYTLTEDDANAGLPFVRATFYSEHDIKVYLHYVNISVVDARISGPKLSVKAKETGVLLEWTDNLAAVNSKFFVYRQFNEKEPYKKIGETSLTQFLDKTLIHGVEYTYVVTRVNISESSGSNKVRIAKFDKEAPMPPTDVTTEIFDTEVKLTWTKSINNDVENYAVYRGDAHGENLHEIAQGIKGRTFLDFTPTKDIVNTYVIYAHDYSGNKSTASKAVKAKLKTVLGASFSDLILPMPIHNKLRSDVWGAIGVVPRDPDNGIEHPDWTYWGGRPVYDKDGKYHMLVTRWPANALKGHWEWPYSTVAHVVSDKPTGPYKVTDQLAYDFHDGLGHNPDIILLNDGTYLLYSLINWEATLFTSKTMNGPWKLLGTMDVDWKSSGEDEKLSYRYYRNLSGVQLEDGRFLFVTKAGEMMMSEDKNPLGPYKVLTESIRYNKIIPEAYRDSNYEDPVLWKDDVQYHMMINAFLDYRAIYLRSPDGIHWKFNPGTAYTPNNTFYEDGTQTHWYKLERPHVLTDVYGRATHLSLAVIDVPKADDLAGDTHNSKNIILPLTVHKRLKMLNKEIINRDTNKIKVLIISEENFDAQKDVDLTSLRYGASEEVNFGRGCKLIKTKKKGKDLILEFDGTGNGITKSNFVGKLIGKLKNGELLVGFSKLVAE